MPGQEEEKSQSQITTALNENASSLQREDTFAWFQVLGAFFLNLNTWGLMNAYGDFQTYYGVDLLRSQSSSNISWIGSTQAFLMFLVSVVVGPILDAGYLKSLLWTGSILTVLGMLLTSFCKEYWQVFAAQGIMMGLGFGFLYLPAPVVVSQYFDASTALAMGTSSSGSALGGVIYPIVFTKLQPRIGFGWATRVIMFIILGTSLVPLALMKSRTAPIIKYHLVDISAFSDLPYILLNFGLIFGFMGLYVVLYYIDLYALQKRSVSTSLVDFLVVILNGSSLVGRLVAGYYGDKIGSITMQAAVAFSSAVLTFCLMAIKNSAWLVAYAVLYGMSAGAFMGLPAAGVVSLSEDKSKIGTRLGMTLAFVGCGC